MHCNMFDGCLICKYRLRSRSPWRTLWYQIILFQKDTHLDVHSITIESSDDKFSSSTTWLSRSSLMRVNLPKKRDANWSRDEEFISVSCACVRIRGKVHQSANRAWSSSGTTGRMSNRPSRKGKSETIDRPDQCNSTNKKHDFKSYNGLLSKY